MVAPYTKIDHATQVFAFTNRTISLKAHELQVCDANFRTCTIYTFHLLAIYAIKATALECMVDHNNTRNTKSSFYQSHRKWCQIHVAFSIKAYSFLSCGEFECWVILETTCIVRHAMPS